jgi:hypothetical protein
MPMALKLAQVYIASRLTPPVCCPTLTRCKASIVHLVMVLIWFRIVDSVRWMGSGNRGEEEVISSFMPGSASWSKSCERGWALR